jgi:hypothetical protein
MSSQMMIEMDTESTFNRLVPRGSLQRFGLAGGFNSGVFFLLWEFLRLFLSDDSTGIRIAWGVAWGTTGFMAHFVHRWFTFDNRKSIQWTIGASFGAYIFSLVGSTYTIGLFATQPSGTLRWLGVANLLAWGIIIWAIMRLFVFQYKTEEDQTA